MRGQLIEMFIAIIYPTALEGFLFTQTYFGVTLIDRTLTDFDMSLSDIKFIVGVNGVTNRSLATTLNKFIIETLFLNELSKRQVTKLKVKINNLFFPAVATTSELSSLLQNCILIDATADNALVHSESVFELNYPTSQRGLLQMNSLKTMCFPVLKNDLATLLKEETSTQARNISVDDLMAQNPQ
ncbi:hypothetical protein GEMRC1_000490 [Eukaryota sp. GEM-RC1]